MTIEKRSAMSTERNERYTFDVFISYSRHDEAFVMWLGDVLTMAGMKFFRDTTDLEIFDRLDASLKINIGQSRWLVAVISPSYLSSYWCMFEAIESVQGQDRDQRFLPIVLKYDVNDRALNEDFVLTSLNDLAIQIEDFEGRMIRSKAYELGSKLEKLNFVRSNLPKIFNHVQERLYPIFEVWKEDGASNAVKKLLRWIDPNSSIDLNVPSFVRSNQLQPRVSPPTLQELPKINWSTWVGHCASKNSPLEHRTPKLNR